MRDLISLQVSCLAVLTAWPCVGPFCVWDEKSYLDIYLFVVVILELAACRKIRASGEYWRCFTDLKNIRGLYMQRGASNPLIQAGDIGEFLSREETISAVWIFIFQRASLWHLSSSGFTWQEHVTRSIIQKPLVSHSLSVKRRNVTYLHLHAQKPFLYISMSSNLNAEVSWREWVQRVFSTDPSNRMWVQSIPTFFILHIIFRFLWVAKRLTVLFSVKKLVLHHGFFAISTAAW